MRLQGKKIGILIESDFAEHEIFYYQHRFPEEGAEIHFLSKLWGFDSLTFKGHDHQAPFTCHESFEAIDDEMLRSFAAIIVPGGQVSDRLRYVQDVSEMPPASAFLKRAFAEPSVVKGINCHGMWLMAPIPELIRGKNITSHHNLYSDVKNMGGVYVDVPATYDASVPGGLVTGQSAEVCHHFAHLLIEKILEK